MNASARMGLGAACGASAFASGDPGREEPAESASPVVACFASGSWGRIALDFGDLTGAIREGLAGTAAEATVAAVEPEPAHAMEAAQRVSNPKDILSFRLAIPSLCLF